MPRSTTYENRKSRGVCVTCGKRPAKRTSVLCRACTHSANVNGALLRHRRRAAGQCIRCDQPAVNGQHCERHRLEVNAYNLIRYRARKRAS